MIPTAGGEADDERLPLRTAAFAGLLLAACLIFIGLVALGNWQLERRTWKLDLIERVQQRVNAPAGPAPGRDEWSRVSAATHEYRRVSVHGTFLHDHETLVQATTVLGGGYWVLTPLRAGDGTIVLVNRGFVPEAAKERATHAGSESAGPLQVTGLLRIAEPGGGFLRRNDAAAGRWYSRDVQGIAEARALGSVAPYFIDAEASSGAQADPGGGPTGGLTVIDFANNHLVYAITWYVLAVMTAVAAGSLVAEERRRRQGPRRTVATG